jgi:inorganic pyrophosphatase
VSHFFSIYKNLGGKSVQIEGFGDRAEACQQLNADRERYRTMDNPPAMPW